jgi:DNA repair protein RadC
MTPKTAPVAYEEPTTEEWEVIANVKPEHARSIAASIKGGSKVHVIDDMIIYQGFHDDEAAQRVAKLLTRQGAIVRYGKVTPLSPGRRGAVNESSEEEEEVPCETGVCKPYTRIVNDPERYQACLALAREIGPIKDHAHLHQICADQMTREKREVFYVMTIDFRGQLMSFEELARGQKSHVSIDVVDIYQHVLMVRPDAFAVAHCHPSGKATPSEADRHLTKTIRDGSKTAMPNIVYLDHIIVGSNEYNSFDQKKLFKTRR